MAEASDTSSSQSSVNETIPLKSVNFLQKLHKREMQDHFRNLGNGHPNQLYSELPKRLKFPITDLVNESILHDGHVFVGFTNDGHYVISYTMNMDVDLPTTFPTYCYKLYFWKFTPHKPMKKISTVKLFRGADIDSELLLKFCQWPLDSNKLVIHGCSVVSDPNQRVTQYPCYITITGVPSITPCEDCKVSGAGISADEDDDDGTNRQTKCLLHAFVLHLEYNLVSPFPSFDPRISLKKSGTIVINTGDSLIVLSIATDAQNISTSSSSTSNSTPESSQKIPVDDESCLSLNSSPDFDPSPASFTNAGVCDCSSSSSTSVELFTSPFRKSRYRWQIHRLEVGEDDKLDSPSSELVNDITPRTSELGDVSSLSTDCSSSPLKSPKQTLKFCHGATDAPLETYSIAAYEETLRNKNVYNESFKENVCPGSDVKSHPIRSTGIYYDCPMFDSDLSSTGAQSQTSNCIINVTQVFLPYVEGESNEAAVADDDTGSWAYQGSLSLEVYWPTSRRLAPRAMTALENSNGPSLVVKQTIFDLEPFVNETAEWLCNVTGKVYQAFTDYDVRIVDVLDNSGNVLALVMILVQASSKNKSHPKTNKCTSGPVRNLYESAFLFIWNIVTGMYEVINTCTLREVEMLKGKAVIPRPWNPGGKACALLQSKWLLPCSPMHKVLVLDNTPAIRGLSIYEIYSPERDVAIVRPHLI